MKKSLDPTKPLIDLIAECTRQYWEQDGGPVVVINHRPLCGDPFIVKLLGPGKPTEKDPSGESDVYSTSVDLLDELAYYALEDTLVNVSDDPKHQTYDLDDVKDRCQALRHLAQSIIDLADEIEGKAVS